MATRVTARPVGETEERVSPLELFFDLVFVFAITQVTAFVSGDPTWARLAQGLLLIAVLWWAWAAYAWLTNTLDPEDGASRLAIFGAMTAMFIASLAVPEAFDDDALIFALAYGVVRIAHLALYALAGKDDPDLLGAVLRFTPTSLTGAALIAAAAFFDGPAQGALWALALAIDFVGPTLGGARGWHLSPGHFAERHALIVIIALGESIVALGIGAAGLDLDLGVVTAGIVGIALAATLWWAYFDVVALVAERKLREAEGNAQLAMARDSYSYLHLPMVAGIILAAVGGKKTLADVGEPLEAVPALGLCGGLALYFLAHVVFRLRNVRTLSVRRLVLAVALLAFTPAALELPALVSLGVVTTLCAGVIAYEAVRYAEARARVRHA
jgi:low temperature requirement protein LtrA